MRETAPLPRKVTDRDCGRQPRSRAVKRLRSLCFGGGGGFAVVPGGHVGVQILFGRIIDQPLSEGLNLINPFKQVQFMSVRTLEMFEHADVPSKEGLTVGLEVSHRRLTVTSEPTRA